MDDCVGGAVAVQQLEGSGLHNQGAALVAPDRYPVDDAEGDAVEGELSREGGANRPRAPTTRTSQRLVMAAAAMLQVSDVSGGRG